MRLDRFVIAEGVDGWIVETTGCEGHRTAVTSDRIEVGTQLGGATTMESARGGRRIVRRGVIHHVSPAEPYGIAYRADEQGSIGVGLTLDPRGFGETDDDRDLRIADPSSSHDPDLVALLAEIAAHRRQGAPLPVSQILRALSSFVARRCELSERDPLARARRAIEDHFDRELYLRHIAEEAGMTETTFLRRFTRRYGSTPIQYRLQVRLTRAGRIAWSEPSATLADVAERTGFREVPYFHRAYRRFFGATPGVHRRSTADRTLL